MTEARLIIAASARDADVFYATRFLAPDPFPFIQVGTERIIMASDLELGRAKKQAAVERVLIEGDLSRAKRKKVVDKMAAAYILQGFMDRERSPGA